MSVGGSAATPHPGVGAAVVLLVAALLVAVPGWWSAASAQPTEDAASEADEGPASEDAAPATEAAVSVRLVHAVDDGAGDLVTDPGTGLPRLALDPDRPSATAVLEVTLANEGDVLLRDLTVTDDLFGTVGAGALEPGAAATVAVTRTVTLDEVGSGLAGLVEHRTSVTGATPDGTAVAASAEGAVLLEAVLATPQLLLEAEVIGSGEVAWTGDEAAAGEERTVPVDLIVTNSGDVDLAGITVEGSVTGGAVTAPAPFDLASGESRAFRIEVVLTPDVVAVEEPLRDGVSLREDVTVDLTASGTTGDGSAAASGDTFTVTAVLGEPVPVRDEAVDQDVVDEPAPQLPAAGFGAEQVALAALAALSVGGLALLSAARERRQEHDLGPVAQR